MCDCATRAPGRRAMRLRPARRNSGAAPSGRPSCEDKLMESGGEFGTVEGADGILTIRGGGNVRGWNGIRYKSGLSAKNVGSKKLSMNVATIPPGGIAYAHIHVDFEVMLYI